MIYANILEIGNPGFKPRLPLLAAGLWVIIYCTSFSEKLGDNGIIFMGLLCGLNEIMM